MTGKHRDLICAVFFFLIGLVMYMEAKDIHPRISGVTLEVGSGYVPRVIAFSLMGLGITLFALTLFRKTKASTKASGEKSEGKDLKGGVYTIGLVIFYAFVFQSLGFLLSSAIYLFLQMLVLSNKQNRNFLLFAGLSIGIPVSLYALFLYGFQMPLPYGILYF